MIETPITLLDYSGNERGRVLIFRTSLETCTLHRVPQCLQTCTENEYASPLVAKN